MKKHQTHYNRFLRAARLKAGRLCRLTTACVGVLAVCLVTNVLPAYATSLPDSTPTVEKFNVYRNVRQPGDMLLLIYGNIPYATPPIEPSSSTFVWRLFKTDNVTEIGAATPYAYNDNGYGYNITSMYFNSANVTSLGITWGTAYPVRLSGNPTYFSASPIYNYVLSASDYSSLTVAASVQTELATRIFALATDLNIKWGLTAAYSLLTETETGTVLSVYGEAFFRNAIYGLQALCPSAFAYVVSDMDLTPRTFASTFVTVLENQWNGTWVDTAKNALNALFGTGYSLAWLLISLFACIVVLILDILVANDAWLGMLDASYVGIVATRLGFIGLGELALFTALIGAYGAARLWGVFR
jgi:hypothetical protein